jgi:hypothetical protein
VKNRPDFIVTSGQNADGSSNGVNISVWERRAVPGLTEFDENGGTFTPYILRYVKVMGYGAGEPSVPPHKYKELKDIMIGSFSAYI